MDARVARNGFSWRGAGNAIPLGERIWQAALGIQYYFYR